jgi:hypothetical protein
LAQASDFDASPAGMLCSVEVMPAASRAAVKVAACNGATLLSEMIAAFPCNPERTMWSPAVENIPFAMTTE